MKVKCKIKTPQFKGGEIHEMKIQFGVFDTIGLIFTPHSVGYKNHTVFFGSIKDWEKALVEKYDDSYNF